MDDDCCNGEGMPPGLAPRVAVSILVVFGWLIFAILWLVFYAGSFDLLQNIAVVVVVLLAGIAILGAMWASWGIKYGKKMEQRAKIKERAAPARSRRRK